MSVETLGVLARILDQTRATIERRKRERPPELLLAELDARGAGRGGGLADRSAADSRETDRRPFRDALARPGIGAIAEFKRRSPSAGELRAGADIAQIARAYERGGAVAMSVLTEQDNFDGSLADLLAARDSCGLALLRKDFVVDPYQLYEARLSGADAVLLIVAALTDSELGSLHEQAHALGLDALVEVHDEHELARAGAVGATIVGVNNRDLRDFSVDLGRTFALLERMPAGALVVSESGIATAEQVRELERQGVAAVLVGESLMRSPDPQSALRELLA